MINIRSTTRNKWALLIGINRYPKLPTHCQLKGCVNDIELMASTLQSKFGFYEENITLLRDEEATREGILTAMNKLLDYIAENDIVVVHYSGHGSQMTDREGDEPDGLDETIVTYDSGRSPDLNQDITDDEIYVWLLSLSEKTPYITLIFDCCHSGTISRDSFGDNERWIVPDRRSIKELPPSPVSIEIAQESSHNVGSSGWLPLSQRYVLIAACHDQEVAYEYKVTESNSCISHGALTYFLNQELLKARSCNTYRDIFEKVSIGVTTKYPSQHPQMEGARDRELFSIIDIEPMRFVPVQKRRLGSIILGAGAAHGMTVGSKWAIYPQATKQVAEETPRLGLVEITAVRAVSCDARVLEEEETNVILPSTRAVEEAHNYGEMRLKVVIHAPSNYETFVNNLTELLEKSALLRLSGEDEAADAQIYLLTPRTEINKYDPVPQLGFVSQLLWAVVGRDGRLMMPTCLLCEADATVILRENLEKQARYRQVRLLENANSNSILQNKVDLILKRRLDNNTWVVAEPKEDGGLIIFDEGERILLEIINRHCVPIYVSVLDLGLTGAISLLYPVEGANERWKPGLVTQIGVRDGQEVELFFPDNFPYVMESNDIVVDMGVETFKLFATTHEADFSQLKQEGFRCIKDPSSPLEQLLDLALTGYGNRDARPNRLSGDEDWTTIERSFFLRRKGIEPG